MTIGTTELIKAAISKAITSLSVSMPARVLAFDVATQLSQVQPLIKDGDDTLAPIFDCPVVFSGGPSVFIEHQINVGDDGIVIFSSKAIDGWLSTGELSDNLINRVADYTDAYFIPGLRAKPNAIPDFKNDGIRLKTSGGSIWIKDTGEIEITGTTLAINVNSTTINSDTVDINGNTLKHNGVNIGDDHLHTKGTDPVTGFTGEPL